MSERSILKNNRISCFADEIDSSIEKQIALLKELGIGFVEFRSGDGKGIASYTLEEAEAFLEDCMAVVLKNLKEFFEYLEFSFYYQ